MYNKLFTKILDSSIWLESTPTRIVWLTFIAVMDESGFAQFAAIGNVAHRARVSLDEAEEAIKAFEGPDPSSSDPDHDGRRLERVPGGWIVLNAEKHRALVTRALKQEQTRERVRKHRAKKRTGNAHVTTSEADTEAEVQNPPTPLSSKGEGIRILRKDRKDAEKIRRQHIGACTHEPRCETAKACVELIAYALAERRTESEQRPRED